MKDRYEDEDEVKIVRHAILDPKYFSNHKFWNIAGLELGRKVSGIAIEAKETYGYKISNFCGYPYSHLETDNLIKVLIEQLDHQDLVKVEKALNESMLQGKEVKIVRHAILDPKYFSNHKFWNIAGLELGRKVSGIAIEAKETYGYKISNFCGYPYSHLETDNLIKVLIEQLDHQDLVKVEKALNESMLQGEDVKISHKVRQVAVKPEEKNRDLSSFKTDSTVIQTFFINTKQKKSASICEEFQCNIL